VLINLGSVLRKSLRQYDTAARYGGEEFAVILPETDLATAMDIAERVRVAIAGMVTTVGTTRLTNTASIGVAAYPAHARDVDGLVKQADLALYRSKQNGRNRVTAAVARGGAE
jgi:diguanylate cyclase (GGDEF)-like protein